MEKFILSLLCKYLVWMVLRPTMIPFLKFLEFVKVEQADKICHNSHSNGFFCFVYYRIVGFCHEDFNVASHGIRNIKIRYIFLSRDFLSYEIL